jgi:CheY-like chemotaxis protein
MPGLDGVALIYKVRHLGGEHDLAIVAISAFLTDPLRARLDAAGADAVLGKELGADAIAVVAVTAFAERSTQLGHG